MHPRRSQSHQSKRFVERRKTRVAIAIGLTVVSVVTWLFTASRLTALPFFTISDIRIDGADADIAPQLQMAALQAIQGSYMGMFSRANTWLYPRKSIRNAVVTASPRISDVNVSSSGLQGLIINVTEKAPAALICPTLPDLSGTSITFNADENCYFADSTGYIYKSAPVISGTIYNRYYIPDDLSGDNASLLGTYATSSSKFAELQEFYDGARAAGIPVLAMLVKDDGEYEMYAEQLSSTVVIYFDDSRPLSEELSNLTAFWSTRVGRTISKVATSSIDSIDIRYGSNVFYRQSN